MAEKVKKTRPELLRRRRALAMFKRFLPTLQLKKQQIQMEIIKVNLLVNKFREEVQEIVQHMESWVTLFSESLPGPITRLVEVADVVLGVRNVAGSDLPTLVSVNYVVKPYSRFATPPWVDKGLEKVKELLKIREQLKILVQQQMILKKELRKVTQRVNLFEKVMIPQSQEDIRVIRIALAEEQTAAVGRGKIAKRKTEAVSA
jgi:V/A-type H+-transporting ATPase subunit D